MFRVRSVWTGVAGAPYYSNFYFEGDTVQEATDSAGEVRELWGDLLGVLRTPMSVAIDPSILVIDPATGQATAELITPQYSNVQFTSVSEALPPATQMQVNLRTPAIVGGRRLRGICYLPGWTVEANDPQGRVLETSAVQVETAFQRLADTPARLVVWSRTAGATAPVTAFSVRRQWSVLRSRRD